METSAPLLSSTRDAERSVDLQVEYLPASARRRRGSRSPSLRTPLGATLCILTGVGMLVAVITLFWSRGYDIANVRDRLLPMVDPKDGVVDGLEGSLSNKTETEPEPKPEPEPEPELTVEDVWKTQVAQLVIGEPTEHFQDNLRSDTQYVTTWVAGGWTNDFMTYINMVYLALLTSRTAVIPPFAPSHVAYDGGFPPFGDVFDVPRLAAAINAPILEWRDIKQENSTALDELGCWTIWGLTGSQTGEPRGSQITSRLRLDVAYTSLPKSSTIISGYWVPFWTLAKLSFPSRRARALDEHPPQTPAPNSHVQLPPDERLLCFDFMYFIGAQDHDEWWEEWSPAWRMVGKHARWEKKLEKVAVGYIQRALGVEEGEEVPPYIAVHVRRGDFTAACGKVPVDKCFAPLSAYALRVASVSATLAARSIQVPEHHVLVTSDETSAAWWAEVSTLGWRSADHAAERTEEKYGKWYLPLIDAVVQSLAVGFVGTGGSTMSLVAKRRVEDWGGGVGEFEPLRR